MFRFLSAAIAYHASLGVVTLRIGRHWWQRSPDREWGLPLACHGFGFSAAAVALAAAFTGLVEGPRFMAMRLLAQGVFGQAVVLAAALALVHWRSGHRWRAALPGGATLLLLAIYVDAYHIEPWNLQVRHHTLGTGEREVRILHLSDLQAEGIGPYEERALRTGLAERPDLIVMTGDYVQERLQPNAAATEAALRALFAHLQLTAPLGVFAVEGDVDRDWPASFAGTGITCLRDGWVRVALPGGGAITLVGLSREHSRSNGSFVARLVAEAPAADLKLVLGHAPDFVDRLAGHASADLALAGHTHGGQVALPFFGPLITLSRLPRRYAGGLADYRGLPLHVSRGIGMERGTAPQIRFLCPPEICVIHLRVPQPASAG